MAWVLLGAAAPDYILAAARCSGLAPPHVRRIQRRLEAPCFENRARNPGRLARKTTASASAISIDASPLSSGRVHATITPCENQNKASTAAQNAARSLPFHAASASSSGGAANTSSAGH